MNNTLLEQALVEITNAGFSFKFKQRIGIYEGSSNLVYLGYFGDRLAVLKIFLKDGKRKIKKEKEFSLILSSLKINSPIIYYANYNNIAFIIEEYLDGVSPTTKYYLLLRARDCAVLHTNTLNYQKNEGHVQHLDLYTIIKRREDFVKRIENLHNRHIISDNILCVLFKIKDILVHFFPLCCTFYDFFPSNSKMKSSSSDLYYFDFERACITIPFFDPACLVLFNIKYLNEISKVYYYQILRSNTQYNSLIFRDVKRDIILASIEKAIEILYFFSCSDNQQISQSTKDFVIRKYNNNLNYLLRLMVNKRSL